MNNAFRNQSIPYLTRKKVKSVVATANTVFGQEKYVMAKTCNTCHEEKLITCYYVKSNRQHIPEDQLNENDFRNQCIECHDAEREKNRARLRLKNEKMVQDTEQLLISMSEEQLVDFMKIAKQFIAERKMKTLKKNFNIVDLINKK